MQPCPRSLALRFAFGAFAAALLPAGVARAMAADLYRDDFDHGLQQWVVEQQPGGTVTTHDGALDINTLGGCTVWFRQPLQAPVRISYDITPLPRAPDPGGGLAFRADPAHAGAISPVSDVNCFWMAEDLRAPGDLWAASAKRTGLLSDYDPLRTYYVGFGSNNNTTTRFRRYAGNGTRPLLPGYDLTQPRFLLTANHAYRIVLTARDGAAEFWRDGERVFVFPDPAPLTHGWFGFRTVRSHLLVRHFAVQSP